MIACVCCGCFTWVHRYPTLGPSAGKTPHLARLMPIKRTQGQPFASYCTPRQRLPAVYIDGQAQLQLAKDCCRSSSYLYTALATELVVVKLNRRTRLINSNNHCAFCWLCACRAHLSTNHATKLVLHKKGSIHHDLNELVAQNPCKTTCDISASSCDWTIIGDAA